MIRIFNPSLDTTSKGVVLRGVIDPASLSSLKVGAYQREILPVISVNKLAKAFAEGAAIPDIELGMRGEDFTFEGDDICLQNDVFVIDGLQRVTAAQKCLEVNNQVVIRLGVTIHFNTTEQWEREHFRILNQDRIKVSPNVLLRNTRHDYPVIEMLYQLCAEEQFVLHGRVSWQQTLKTHELVTASTLIRTASVLHTHLGGKNSSDIVSLIQSLQNIADSIGIDVIKENVILFFNVLDMSFGIKEISIRQLATHLRGAFLQTLAKLLSDHVDFWQNDDKKLVVKAAFTKKLKAFPIKDQGVAQLASLGGKSSKLLYIYLLQDIQGKNKKYFLTSRHSLADAPPHEVEE